MEVTMILLAMAVLMADACFLPVTDGDLLVPP